MKQRNVLPNLVTYNALMQVFAATGQTVRGFELVAQAEVLKPPCDSDEDWYSMFRILLEACRATGDSHSASRV